MPFAEYNKKVIQWRGEPPLERGSGRTKMEIFKNIREKNRIIAAIAAWQKTVWYPILYAALGVVSCSFGMAAYIPVYYLFMLSTLFSVLFCDDTKVLLVPLLISYFAAGGDGILNYGQAVTDITLFFHPAGLINMYVVGAVMVAAIAFRLIADGTIAAVFRRRGLLTWSLLCLAGALFLNGAFSPAWEPLDLALGLFQAVGLVLTYFIVLAMSGRTEGIAGYILRICLIVGLMICAEEFILMGRLAADGMLLELDEAGNWTGGFVRDYQVLGWGVSTYAAGVLAILIAPAMALAYSSRRGVWCYMAALVMFLTIILLNARTAMLMGGIVLLACMIICCFGPNRKQNRILLAAVAAAAVLCVAGVWALMGTQDFFGFIAEMLRFDQGDNHRFERWGNGWKDFLSAPIFGVGFMDGAASDPFVYSNMYHNIFVQLIGAAGILGLLAFLFHLVQVCVLGIRKFRMERLLVLLGAAAVVLTSLLDNFFFYFSVQLFYGAFLAVAEIMLEKTRREELEAHRRAVTADRKPRVVFTFIEAGMGHIIPERAVADAMEQKYGGKVEVVRSYFYSETGNAELKKFGQTLVKPVEKQSRSRFYGKLCMFGLWLFGDTISHEFVMRMRGPKSVRPALEHMRELDADVVFTTHWASTYYINKLRENRPYSVLFCPDCYSNGMFNMDCNDFLIPTEQGLRAANSQRMYAGGNGRAVDYPLRGEAFALKGRRAQVRRELNIPEGRFTVVLSDGGYGMAKLEETVTELVKHRGEITIIAVCGKNEEGAARLKKLQCAEGVDLRVFGFTDKMLEFLCAADLYAGKSGANSMVEPAFFGLPVIVTKCITTIETHIKDYYVETVGNAMYIPSAKLAAEKILYFAEHRAELEEYARKARGFQDRNGAEQIADLLFDCAMRACAASPASAPCAEAEGNAPVQLSEEAALADGTEGDNKTER